jgi:hypothetical protein
MLGALLAEKPRIVSFHFGLPSDERIRVLRETGAVLLATATSIAEGRAADDAGYLRASCAVSEQSVYRAWRGGFAKTDSPVPDRL